jgi:3-oxoadipate CoA-transferase alpha subunit
VGTLFEAGKEKRVFDDQEYVLEYALHADFALIKAKRADTLGNLVYDMTQRNHGPTMAMAARVTIVEVDEVVEPGLLDPEAVVTPGIFVDRLVVVGGPQEDGR